MSDLDKLIEAGDVLARELARSPGIDVMRSVRLQDWANVKSACADLERKHADTYARLQQRHENDQVSQLRKTGFCPVCGAEADAVSMVR